LQEEERGSRSFWEFCKKEESLVSLSKNSLVNMIALGLVLFSLSNCAVRPSPEQIASADYGPYPENYQEIIKNYYSKILFDLYSPEYTYENPTRTWNSFGGALIFGWAVCGTFDAKNRSSGYVGAKPFYVLIRDNKIEREYTEELADRFCQDLK
jgi:hypothetical protein